MRAGLLEPRLFERMGRRESRHCKTTVGKAGDDGKGTEFEFEKVRADHLPGDADICEPHLRAERKWRRDPASEQPLISRQPFGGPMLAPILDRLGVCTEGFGQMVTDARHHQRMGIGSRHQGERTRIGALLCIRWNEPRFRLDVVQIFNDRQRLEDRMAVVDERRHHAFGVDSLIARLELFPGKNIDRSFIKRQSLESERDPHTKGSDRPPESVDLYAHRTFLS